jgi:hypothetical protein
LTLGLEPNWCQLLPFHTRASLWGSHNHIVEFHFGVLSIKADAAIEVGPFIIGVRRQQFPIRPYHYGILGVPNPNFVLHADWEGGPVSGGQIALSTRILRIFLTEFPTVRLEND